MKWILATTLLTAVAALRIETPPSLVACQPAAIVFADGQPPYFIAVLPAGQVSATPLEQFPEVNASPYTWNVNLPAGTNITLRLTDASGQPAYSSPMLIQEGPNTCASTNGTTSTGGGGASSGGASSGGALSASASATSGGGASGSAAAQSATSAATSAAQSSGAAALGKQVGGPIVGLLGLIAAAVGAVM